MTTTTKISDFAQRIKGLSDYRSDDHSLRSETASAFAALLEIVVERAPSAAGVEVLQAEVTDLRRQKSDLEAALTSTMTAWHKDKAALESTVAALTDESAKTREAYRVAFASELGAECARFTSALDKATAERDVATKRAELAEAMLESVRAAVAKPALDKEDTRPKIGDTVPWSEMEDGLYHRPDYPYPFAMVVGSRVNVVDHDDRAVASMLDGSGRGQLVSSTDPERVVFVARDLGTDPEAWRAAMREHLAKVGK